LKKEIIVCKIGGSIVEGIDPSIVNDVRELISENKGVILVHGGGDRVTEVAEKLGKKQQFITSPEGIKSRYTDLETAEIFTMVMSGNIAKRIVQTLEKSGINSISLTGVDGNLLRAGRKKRLVVIDERGRKVAIEGGFTGKIKSVNTDFLASIIEDGLVPVISPIAAGDEWELLNIDGDRACSHVAGAMSATASVYLTDMEGLILDDHLVRHLSVKEARDALPRIGAGMDKKIIAAAEAVEMGCGRSIIASGLVQNPLRNALLGKGTEIINDEQVELEVTRN
jgi:acetylglutamate/LysW-gamma-L-alpha-aminoadipate kinase